MFVVANSYPANGTSVPRDLIAGHWGDMLNFTSSCGSIRYAFIERYGQPNATLIFSVNATVPESMLVYLDLGSSNISNSILLNIAWTC